MPAHPAVVIEPQFRADRGGPGPLPAPAPRAKAAAELAQLVSELGEELVRYYADRRLRLDRTPLPPATEVLLVATVPPGRPSAARPFGESPADSSTTLRAATTVMIRQSP